MCTLTAPKTARGSATSMRNRRFLGRRHSEGRAIAAGALGGGGVTPPALTELPGFDYTLGSYADFAASLAATGCDIDDLGVCSDGSNHVYGLQYGDTWKQCVFLLGVQHGAHEWRNAYIIRKFMEYLVTPPAGGAELITPLLDRFQFYAIPCANPHGFSNNDYCNAAGVNLNRNWDNNWSDYDDSGDVCANGKGASAFSEVETQYIRDAFLARDVVTFVDYHVLGTGSPVPNQVSVLTDGVTAFWGAMETAFEADGYTMYATGSTNMPMAHAWAMDQVTGYFGLPYTALCETAELIATETERARITLNWTRIAALQAVEDVPAQGTLQPDGTHGIDTYITNFAADTDYGVYPYMRTGTAALGQNYRGLIAFDLSGIPPGATITSATLALWCVEESATVDHVVGLHRALTQWYEGPNTGTEPDPGEDASTWNHRNANGDIAWGTAGGQAGVDYAATATDTATITGTNAEFSWDVTADVAAFIAGTNNYGWWLINESEGVVVSRKGFATSDHVTTTYRPRLTIEFTV